MIMKTYDEIFEKIREIESRGYVVISTVDECRIHSNDGEWYESTGSMENCTYDGTTISFCQTDTRRDALITAINEFSKYENSII